MNWHHLKCILLLRWQLTRNQVRKSGGLGTIVAGILALLALMLVAASFGGGFLIGALVLKKETPQAIMAVWHGLTVAFLFTWITGVVTQLQRAESIDLQQLLHLPVPLGQVFVFNFIASHLTWLMMMAIPGIVGLAVGLVVSRSGMMALLLPLALGMVFMVSAWTYCLRGWLAAMIANPRKRRSLTVILFVTMLLLILATGWYFTRFRPAGDMASHRAVMEAFRELPAMGCFFPPLWLPMGAQALAENNPWSAVMGSFGFWVIGAAGLMLAYRDTLKFQRGATGARVLTVGYVRTGPGQASSPAHAQSRSGFLETRIPMLPEECGAVALAEFRSLLRAPEIKIMLCMLVLLPVLFIGSQLTTETPNFPETRRLLLIPSTLVFMAVLMMPLAGNQFGYSRDGFRCMVLSPVERRWLLLGRNLAFLPFVMFTCLLAITMISVRFRLSMPTILAGLFQLASMTALLGIIGNLVSIRFPFRIASAAVKPTKKPAGIALAMMLGVPVLPLAFSPLMLPALVEVGLRSSGHNGFPAELPLSAALATVMVLAYWLSLKPIGRMLERHEVRILAAVTAEVE